MVEHTWKEITAHCFLGDYVQIIDSEPDSGVHRVKTVAYKGWNKPGLD